jgi:hypothetical protein
VAVDVTIRTIYSSIDGWEWFVERGRGDGRECLGAGTGYHREDAITRARVWMARNTQLDVDAARID